MPPAVNPMQGSRSGLITGMVLSLIIAVAMIVVAVYFAQQNSTTENKLSNQNTVYKPVVTESDISDSRVERLKQLASSSGSQSLPEYQSMSALEVSMAEADQLAKLAGSDVPPDQAIKQIRTVLASASNTIGDLNTKKLVNFTLPPNASLAQTVAALADQVKQLAESNKSKDDQLAQAGEEKQKLIAAQKEQLDQKDKQIQGAEAKASAALAEVKQYQDQAALASTQLQQTADQGIKKIQDTNADLTKQLATANKQLASDRTQIEGLKGKLHISRVNPGEAIVQHADGNILRLTDNNTCFINLGARQLVTPGLTFEVFDKNKGIPPLGEGLSDANMPVGKGSIEVFKVGQDSSECRVIKLQSGEQLVIGDLIQNLVYDPNTRYNFVVYGDFDLSNTSAPTPSDTEIVRRLITQWGGHVQDHIDVDTDFVVMGAEPTMPTNLDPTNPGDELRRKKAKENIDKYLAVENRAQELSVPIMNQNRFLYFIGYYDQAKR